MRRIAAEHIIATGNKDKRWTDVYLHLEEEVKTAVEALQAVIRQMGEQAAVLAKDGMAARAQVEALQAEKLMLERGVAAQSALIDGLQSQLIKRTADLEALQRERDEARHTADVYQKLYGTAVMDRATVVNELSELRALVRALPVPEEGGFPIVEVDGDYYVNHTSRFSTKAEADAYTGLLIYRATLDATTPARGQELEDK